MADNHENPGRDQPEGVPPFEGQVGGEADIPPDFFDDAVDPEGTPLTPAPTHEYAVRGHTPSYLPPSDRPLMPIFPALLGLILAGATIAAWLLSKPHPGPATIEAAPPPTSPESQLTKSLAGEFKGVHGQVEALTAQLKGLESKLVESTRPEPAPAPDLKPLQAKVDDLARSVAQAAPLADRIDKLHDRLGSVDGELKAVKDDLSALKDEVAKAATKPADARPAEVKPEADDTAAALTQGTDLFKAGKYREAGDVFKRLASANAKDARVYYYAALINGLTTGNWQGDTLTTAARGAELEKAGSPGSADVDAAFADLPAALKPWLAFFRKQAR
jgi:hypothetical protein